MKIFIVTSEFPPLPGGIGNHAFSLFTVIGKLGHNIRVFTNSRNFNEEKQWLKRFNIEDVVRYIPRSKFKLITYFSRLLGFFNEFRKLYNDKDVKFIFSGKFSIWILGIFPFSSFLKKIVVIHGSEIKQSFLGFLLFQRAINKADKVISVSSYTQKRLHTVYNLCISKSCVINNGFLPPEIKYSHSYSNNLSLITVGSISYRKGQFNVVRALPMILHYFPLCTYDILGVPHEVQVLESEIKLLNLNNTVFIHGAVSENKKWELLTNSNVFMMLSEELDNGDFEGFGIAILEANSIGIPAIGSKNSGIADAIENGYNGFLVDPHKPEEVTEALNIIMSDYQMFSSNSRKHASMFHWDIKINEYLKILI
jgi:glycosyltransferase involved in cell wall biosynthesis